MTLILCYVWVECRFISSFFFHSFWKHLSFMINTMKFSMCITNNNHFNSFNKQQLNWYHFIHFCFCFSNDVSFHFFSSLHFQDWYFICVSLWMISHSHFIFQLFWEDLTIQHFKFQNMSFIHFQFNQNEFCCWNKTTYNSFHSWD